MTQQALFESPTALAREAGRIAGEQCAAKAEGITGFSQESARHWILAHLEQHGPTSGEDMVDGMVIAGLVPQDMRAFGPVFAALAREDEIAHYGFTARRKGHGTAGAIIWRRVGKRGHR
jgi:hypothetical protein